ncbi:hypothetical protein HPB49_005421 [Dermacentor silvarum]|uniref:Uncharacterized protein n=1 Tax=Dermacentor silvarum TaxID=543639 RepID=A0ACB8CVC4_DERSI|nr:hypothetical protein HPB49_005421 [Dermacentor silvarum]
MAAVKWLNLQISAKPEIIRRVKHGEKKSDVAAAYSIPRSTLRTILKNNADVRAKADKGPGATGTQRIRTAAYEDVEAAVCRLMDVRSRNDPISGPVTEPKGKDFAFRLNRPDFKGGSGWLQRFKERHSIVGQAVTSESCAVDVSSMQKWIEENWSDIMTSSSENCDEPIEELDLFSQVSEFPGAVCDWTAATDFVTVDDHVVTTGELADEDIVADLARDLASDSNCEDPTSSDPATCSDALHALSVVRRHCASVEGCGLSFSESLNNVEKCMLNDGLKMKKQKICDYFSC